MNKKMWAWATGAALTLAGSGVAYGQVNQPPKVSLLSPTAAVVAQTAPVTGVLTIASPQNGVVYAAPAVIGLAASATDFDGSVTRVDYYDGGILIGSSAAAPFPFVWGNAQAGLHTVTAKAIDNLGAVTASSPISIAVQSIPATGWTAIATEGQTTTLTNAQLVRYGKADRWVLKTMSGAFTCNNATFSDPYYGVVKQCEVQAQASNLPPVVRLLTPGGVVAYGGPGTISLSAYASDPDGAVQKVEYYNGNVLLGSSTVAPYTFNWSGALPGSYRINAKAYDSAGAVTSTPFQPVQVLGMPTTGWTRLGIEGQTLNLTSNAMVRYGVGDRWVLKPMSGSFACSNATFTDPYVGAVKFCESYPINIAPTVSLTAPVANASYMAPASVVITAAAADSDGTIAKVEYYNGTTLLGTSTAAPYSFTWSNVAVGSYSLTAKATDNTGAVTTSTPAAVTVKAANVAPTVSLTAPATNASYTAPAAVTITATAADSDGTISKIEFYNGATLLAGQMVATSSVNTSGVSSTTYTLTWANVPAGAYSLTARATDNTGAATSSTPVAITVKAANVAPTVSLTAPAANASYTSPASVVITAAAADSDGTIAKVEYYNGTTLLGSSTVAPYSFTWSNVVAGSYSLTAKATDNTGAVTTSAAVAITVNAAPVAATTLYFVHTDHLGTPRLIADQTKKTIWRWDNQEPFGQTGLQEDPDADGKTFTFNLRFAGQYYDQESGLHYNRNRDYDPATGRYVQADPIGLSGGISLYSYVSGNPLSFIDPLGLAKCDDTTRVRHYTNRKGSNAIEESGVIRAQDNNRVYVEPANKKPLSQVEAESKYQIDRGRGRDYVETDVETSSLEWVKNPRYGRQELTVKGDVPLQNENIVRRR